MANELWDNKSMVGLMTPERNATPKQHKSHECYTPEPLVVLARRIMGGIDLDPASSAAANEVVKATWYYDKDADGLSQLWYGKVFCNPPFNHGMLRKFARRMVHKWEGGSLEAGCLLAPHASGSTWPNEAFDAATAVIILKQHIPWWGPESVSGALLPTLMWCFGGSEHTAAVDACPLATGVMFPQPPPVRQGRFF